MKRLLFTVFLVNVVLPLTSFAQDNTKIGLPEGAITRLGKGGINLMRFSPDGTRLAVGTDVGVWLYDVTRWKRDRAVHRTYWTSQRTRFLNGWKNTRKRRGSRTLLSNCGIWMPIVNAQLTHSPAAYIQYQRWYSHKIIQGLSVWTNLVELCIGMSTPAANC